MKISIKNFENEINNTIDLFLKRYCKSEYEINDGFCEEFSGSLITKFGGNYENLFELDSQMFLNELSVIGDLWPSSDLIHVSESIDSVWSKRFLKMYGSPPIDVNSVIYIPLHVWICYNGKHYDAESPHGEISPWNLKIFDRYFKFLKT